MPDAKVGNPRAGKPNGKPGTKGAPLGIPKWGWIVGIALGLVVGYMVIKKSGSGSSGSSSSGSDSSPLGNSDSGVGGGAVAGSPSPNNPIVGSGNETQGPGADPGAVSGSGDSSTSTNPVTYTYDVPVPSTPVNPFVNPFSTPSSGGGMTNPGSQIAASPGSYTPGGNIITHGFTPE